MANATHSIVVCGAGIAGIAAAYNLAVVHGCENVVLVEEGSPLSLTSDKSTEAYRNWWPDPDPAMTAYMNASIDMLEAFARKSGNRINLNRRGYLFASADASKAAWLHEMATRAAEHGAGSVRMHERGSRSYDPSPDIAYDAPIDGADIVTDPELIRQHYPYLARTTWVVAHARRAGWLSAQQLGMTMLEAFREHGGRLINGRVTAIDQMGARVSAVLVEQAGGQHRLEATHVVLATGPGTMALMRGVGLDLPLFAERHLKISLADVQGVIPRTAPMMIWLDEQRLPWSDDERAMLADDDATRWLTLPFPGGVHGRPDGRSGNTLLVLFNYDNAPKDVVFPLPDEPHYADIALRGMSTMVPGLAPYIGRARPYVDGGYYIKTQENRPLIGPTKIDGLFISVGFSGFGIMAACAGGDLAARHTLGLPLPSYAPSFLLSRYRDPAYLAKLATWGDGSQL